MRTSVSPSDVISRIVQHGKNGAVLTVHVQPNAAHTACAGIHGDALKIRIAAPPIDGAANKELIRFLANELSLPAAALCIESGAGGRRKRVCVGGMTAGQVVVLLIQKGWIKKL